MIAVLALLLAAAEPVTPAVQAEDQAVLAAYSAPVAVPGGTLWLTMLTNRSIEALWRDDPARATLQIEVSNAATSFYVMGVATRPLRVAPDVEIEQDGARTRGRLVNVAHLDGADVPEGAAMLGLIEFDRRIDPARPFRVTLGGVSARFAIDGEAPARWRTLTAPAGPGF